jgi:autotransporter-associated beta strand protein
MTICKSVKSYPRKSVIARRRVALLAAVGVPLVGTAGAALGDIAITYTTVGSSQLFLPQTGTYTLEVAGAQGGSNGPILAGGFGAVIEGTTASFTSRDSLSFYVGGIGVGTSDFTLGGGGGGGSFLFDNTTSSLLVAAGGGGGEGGGVNGGIGQTANAGNAGGSASGEIGGAGGTAGNGGQAGVSSIDVPDGAGGGGFVSAGGNATATGDSSTGGGKFSGLSGGTTTEPGLTAVTGGFGGGGAAGFGGGGGGGFSGGGGGGDSFGGGGGSFVATSVIASGEFAGANADNGFIIFSPTTFNLTINYANPGTIAGAISGGGAVIMAGGGNPILTSTSNSWTGGTTISSGTFTIGDGGADGSLPGNVTNNSKLVFNSSSTLAVAGNISGTGSLTQSGTGTTVLTGSNTYSGATTISAGALQFGNGGSPGLFNGNITDNATLLTDLSGQQSYTGVISGTGAFTTTGPGVINLTKQQTYGGATTIENTAIVELIANALPATTNLTLTGDFVSDGGVLALGGVNNGAQTVASLSGDGGEVGLSPNAVLTVNQSTNTVFAGQIDDHNVLGPSTDTGKLVKQGAGTLTLTGVGVYGGGTTISGGSLQIGNGGTTGSVAGNITDNANLAFNRTDSITFSGNITGSGSLTQLGSGTLVLTGAASHTGGTTISAGSLQIGNGGTTGSITGNITDNANLTFNLSSTAQVFGLISGTGSLTDSSSAALELFSANTYMGNTVINSGFLFSVVNNALPTTTHLIVNDNGVFVLNTNVSQTVGSLTGTGFVETSIGPSNTIFEVNQSSNTVFDGEILDGTDISTPDTLQFIKQGSGNLTLTGDSVYAGGTTISAGTLQIGNGASGSITGNILDNAQLTYDLNNSSTVSGLISGSGSMTEKGTGTVVLTATNTYTGGTTISSTATLQLSNGGTTGSLSSTGAIIDNGNLTFDRTDNITVANLIHGNGSLTQAGSGTVTLSTSNNYFGTTSVTAGKLIIGAVNGIADSPVSISAGAVLQLAPNTGEEDITGLTITGGTFDITNNHLFISYTGTDPISTVAGYLASGYADGTWTGTGIDSSTAALPANKSHFALGYADGADDVVTGLSSGQIEIKYTLLGDANLDGVVNADDFTILVGNLFKVRPAWDKGDFNYDGVVNGDDFTLLVGNLGKQANGADVALPASDWMAIDAFAAANGLMADVPEPASFGLLGMAAVGFLARRRRFARIQSED